MSEIKKGKQSEKPKFRNNRRKLNKEELVHQLLKEYESILRHFKKSPFGKSEHLANDLFPKYRALLCSGRSFKPLLIRVISEFNFN